MSYFDYAATSPILPEVREAMFKASEKLLGNASALHSKGHLVHEIIENARLNIAKYINANPEEIIFTSGSTESNNMVMHTFADKNIAISNYEHPSIVASAEAYSKNLHRWSQNQKIPKDITLVSVMLASNEIGTILDLPHGNFYLHSDATAAIGKIPIDVKKLDVDYLTISGHKIGGPSGIGVLYIKKDSPIKPLLFGGNQENNLRPGSHNTIDIIGFDAAIKYALEHDTPKLYKEKVAPLKDYLKNAILKNIPNTIINTPKEPSLPDILNVSFPGAEGESVQLMLDESDIQVATGSACASGKPSAVLMALTNNPYIASSSIRFSLGLQTTKSDIDKIIEILPNIIAKLRSISAVGEQNE